MFHAKECYLEYLDEITKEKINMSQAICKLTQKFKELSSTAAKYITVHWSKTGAIRSAAKRKFRLKK